MLAAVDPDRGLDDVPDELSWLLDRAASYRQTRGQARAALPLFERAYATRRVRLGDDHPDTLGSAGDLGFNLAELGEHEQARDLEEDTLSRRRRVLGDDHPDTLTSACSLAGYLVGLGQYEQADMLEDQISSWRAGTDSAQSARQGGRAS